MALLDVLETLIGRRRMWKLGRRIYLHARRQGSLDFETNGEAVLQKALVSRSKERGRGLTVYDVGANHGQWSRSLLAQIAQAGAPKASLVQFEPMLPIIPSLKALREEYAEHATAEIVECAVSDAPGTAEMVFTGVEAGNHHILSDAHQFDGEQVSVPTITLDQYHRGHQYGFVDAVKIDAEGFDPKVMAGMSEMFANRAVGIVQFEYSPLFIRSRAYLSDIFTLAESGGYRVGLLTSQGVEIFEEWHPDMERFYPCAFVVVHPDWLDLMPGATVAYDNDDFAYG